MHLSTRTKAILALVATGILGGASPLFMKIALKEFSSYQILFIRFSIATLIMSPFLAKYLKTITFKRLSLVIPSGILFSSNVFFFIVGLQYTTSIVSQLFYLLVPVIVSIISYIFFREKTSTRRIISMIICFGGATLLIIRSVQGGNLIHSIGTFQGNLLILCAVVSWSFYSVYTKHISKNVNPHSTL